MAYIAVHNVRIGGRSYTPGEIITGDIPSPDFMVRKGAIRLTESAFFVEQSVPDEQADREIRNIDISGGVVDTPTKKPRRRKKTGGVSHGN